MHIGVVLSREKYTKYYGVGETKKEQEANKRRMVSDQKKRYEMVKHLEEDDFYMDWYKTFVEATKILEINEPEYVTWLKKPDEVFLSKEVEELYEYLKYLENQHIFDFKWEENKVIIRYTVNGVTKQNYLAWLDGEK